MGTYNNSLDDKDRLIVPSKHRNKLGGSCVITKGLDKCLYIYTVNDWEKQMEKVAALPESDPKVRAFIRHFCANAQECDLDKQGRVKVPASLKAYAGIDRELVTMGAMRKIEIWSKELWESPDNSDRMDSEEYSRALSEYNF